MSSTNIMDKKEKEADKELIKFNKMHELFFELVDLGLPIKNARFYEHRINYFRGKDFMEILKANLDKISPKFKEIIGSELGTSEKNYCQNFYTEYLKKAMILKVLKPEEEKKKKYPKFLIGDKELETFEDSKYYWAKMDFPKSNKNNFYLFIVIFLILLFCMFSLWPLWFKHFVWWLLFISLCFMTGFLVLRLVIYITCFIFGYDVWLLPNVMVDNRRFVESLSPIIGYYPRDDSISEILIRIFTFALIIGASIYSYQHPDEFFEAMSLFKSVFNNIETWGYDKLTNMHNGNNQTLSRNNKFNTLFNQ